MAKNHPSYERKQFLINRPFQLKFLKNAVGMGLIIIGMVYAANHFFFMQFIEFGQAAEFAPGDPYFTFIEDQKELMNSIFLFTAICISAALGVGGLLFSHRIAGPIYRIKKHMDDTSKGKQELKKIHFRDDDFFQELAESYNNHVEFLKK
ncbi:MAG: hypothetical protein CL678_09280 [Bdellovibrionaceae bacterium]|nr:hypothetical protein [Pseudobdellovibrionaceae bacterium]|tara:strand:+ start:3989 stop:4438 length:450 start_codon:yes stop_codon:yes gene_type:complete